MDKQTVTLVHVGTHGGIALYALPGSPKVLGCALYDRSKCERLSWIHIVTGVTTDDSQDNG